MVDFSPIACADNKDSNCGEGKACKCIAVIFMALAQKSRQTLFPAWTRACAITFVFKMATIKAPCQKSLSKLVDSEENGKK
jgi:hypothetical protein